MIEFAKVEFDLSKFVGDSKKTKREQLEHVKKVTGKTPPSLIQKNLPPELSYLWYYWQNMHGGELLTFTEIQAWSILNDVKLNSLEVYVLRQLDVLFFQSRSKK